ncbi:MAG: GNAT family N-acetyltransferase [Calothrix sp. SM1_5_4]|nr:GNAT family N-acetyltransferase [Calothrix sp. SM1_5_4]
MTVEIQQPTIQTKRLSLTPFRSEDLKDIFDYASDEVLTRFLTWKAHRSLDDSRAFLRRVGEITSARAGDLCFVFAIRERENGRVIGSIDFKNTNRFCGQIDYCLARPRWNQGLMAEATSALRDWVFANVPGLIRLQSYCDPRNIGSRRVMEKIGMQYEGLLRKWIIVHGNPRTFWSTR